MRPMTHRPPHVRRTIALGLSTAAVAVAGAGVAAANTIPNQASSNWAGWVATAVARSASVAHHFTNVAGSWVQPSATCTPHKRTFAAFWVGLGGYSRRPPHVLEQVGSEADCSARGRIFYYAWYEFVPRPPITIARLRITPGDSIRASVHVSSGNVTVALTDTTTGARFRRRVVMHSPPPDTSAADWIAEAPSNCEGDNCRPLRLTNFGQVGFSSASATAIGPAGRHTGPINDPHWDYGEIVLSSSGKFHYSLNDKNYALPSSLSPDGAAFTVRYGPTVTAGPTGTTGASGTSGPTGPSGTTGAAP
jgi:hypothetical protein